MSAHLTSWLPAWAKDLLEIITRPEVIVILGFCSVALFVLSLLGVPWFLARVPADYFSTTNADSNAPRDSVRELRRIRRRGFARFVLHGLKNLVGIALMLVGIVMLFAPGQGLLTLFVSSFFLDFPGKHAMQRWVVARPSVLSTINALRRRRGRPPLVL